MQDTAKRVALAKKRARECLRRTQRRSLRGMSALCMLLFAALVGTMRAVIGQTQPAAQGMLGAMLLHADAGGYVFVSVVSFAAAAALTVLCFRLRIRENQKKGGADKPNRHEQEEKSQ